MQDPPPRRMITESFAGIHSRRSSPGPILRLLLVAAALSSTACAASRPSPAHPVASSGTFRVGVWNVAESSFVRRPEAVRRILQEANADIYSFDEVGAHTTPDDLLRVLRGLRGTADSVWHLSWGVGGDYQRTVIASRSPLEHVAEFSPLPFPPASERIIRRAPDSLHARLQSDFAKGVAANAAVVDARGRRLLLVGLDLWARGNAKDSWEAVRREVEAAAIRDAIAAVVARLAAAGNAVDGIVVGGDMNLVAGRAPLDTLLALSAGRLAALTPAQPLHADGWSTWTWDGRGGPFHSSRMDMVLYSGKTLDATGASVVNWDVFPVAERAALGPVNAPVVGLSRHRPIMVDLRWR